MTVAIPIPKETLSTTSFTQGDSKWAAYRKRALEDLYWFAAVVLGYGDKIPMNPSTHLLLCKFLERKTGSKILDTAHYRKIEMPRETGKSTLARAYAIQRICKDPNIAILLINEKELLAKDFLSDIKYQFESNQLLQALFPELLPRDLNATTWSATRILVNRTSGRPDPTIDVIGVGGAVAGKHPDLIIADDMISREAMENARAGSWQIMHQTNRWVNQLDPLVNKSALPYPEITFIGCIAEGSRVLMADGTWREIQNIEVGEKVWSWDAEGASFKAQTVTGVWPQGEADTVRVRTGAGRTSIQTTPNHPFLTAAGIKDPSKVRWHRADWFKPYSPVQMVAETPGVYSGQSYEACWLAGFLMGDGWVTKYQGKNKKGNRTSYSVSVARSVYPELNAAVVGAMKTHLGAAVYETATKCFRIDSNVAGKKAEELGLRVGVRAPHKRLPQWIFNALPDEKRAYLRGLCDADGNRMPAKTETHRLSTASAGLAEDVKLLALTCGVRPTSIHKRTRKAWAPNSPKPTDSTEYSIGLRFEKRTGPLREWRVMSVEKDAGKVPVWDLSIEGTENFVCEGFVVHNTRWWHNDSYEHIEKAYGYDEDPRVVILKAQTPTGQIQLSAYKKGDLAIFRRAAIEEGRSIFPEKWDLEKLAKIRMTDPALFAANYMNEPSDDVTATFKQDWLLPITWLDDTQFYITDGSAKKVITRVRDLDKLILVDPGGFGERVVENRARAAAVVVGDDFNGHKFFLDCHSQQQTFLDAIEEIVALSSKYQPRKIYVERAGQQAAFASLLRQALQKANLNIIVDDTTLKAAGDNKDVRILEMEPYFQRGEVFVGTGPSFHEFKTQYAQYPRAARKDILDILGYWPRLMRKHSSVQNNPDERRAAELATYRSKRKWRAA